MSTSSVEPYDATTAVTGTPVATTFAIAPWKAFAKSIWSVASARSASGPPWTWPT